MNVVGDVLLAGGCVAYLGCFTVDVCIPHTIHINYKKFHVMRAVTFTRILHAFDVEFVIIFFFLSRSSFSILFSSFAIKKK